MNEFDLRTYTFGPASGGVPRQLVILLHGLGADGNDLLGLAPLFSQALPDAVFVSPDAPHPCDMAPYGFQWFSLLDRSPDAIERGAAQAAPVLDSFIATQMERYGVPADRTVLVGFSQGTMMALYAAPRFPQKLAGVLGYSGALVGGGELSGEGMMKPPIHLIHGDSDMVVDAGAFYAARDVLTAAEFPVTGAVLPGLAHAIDGRGIDAGADFLRRILQ